jgi:hypothetical protein
MLGRARKSGDFKGTGGDLDRTEFRYEKLPSSGGVCCVLFEETGDRDYTGKRLCVLKKL